MSRYYRTNTNASTSLNHEYTNYVYATSSTREAENEEVVERLGLKVVYEDPEILVVTAPNEDELRNIILNLLREKPMSVKEIHSILAGIASEDKIRRSLMRLAEEGVVTMDEEGRYKLLGFY